MSPHFFSRSCHRISLLAPAAVRTILVLLTLVVGGASLTGAATITVGGACTLTAAIHAANTDALSGFCSPGSGPDTLILTSAVILTSVVDTTDGDNGTPSITTDVTIDGNLLLTYLVRRSATAADFRIFHIGAAGKLTLKNMRVAGGRATNPFSAVGRNGGGILNKGELAMQSTWVLGNHADLDGGGIWNGGPLTMTHGFIEDNTADAGGGVWNNNTLTQTRVLYSGNEAALGGGLHTAFMATLDDCDLSSNHATVDGGGISTSGTLQLADTTLSTNTAVSRGGGIFAGSGWVTFARGTLSGNSADLGGGLFLLDGSAELEATSLTGNQADADGGAALNEDSLTLTDCSVSGNSAVNGAGIDNSGTLTVNNSTLSGNDASNDGGAVRDQGFLSITNSTLSANRADRGGAVFASTTSEMRHCTFHGNHARWKGGALYIAGGGISFVTNSAIGSSTPQNCDCDPGCSINPGAGSLQADDMTCGFITATLTGLDPVLGDHGGRTPTHALRDFSSAIDGAGSNCTILDPEFAADQRRAPRVGDCDVGAFEYLGCPTLELSAQTFSTPSNEFEECQINAGPDVTVAGPSGALLLRAGRAVVLDGPLTVESNGELAIEIDPALELFYPELIAAERARRAGNG